MNRSQTILASLLLACIAVLTIWGTAAEKQNEENLQASLAKYKVAPEFIKTNGLQPPAEFQAVTTGKYGTATTYWVMAETDDWVLFNGPRGTDTCPQVLGDFGYINARNEVMSAARVRLMAAGFKDRPVELQVLVPRFHTLPANLERCPGFGYDAATGLLKVGAKHIAYLTESQPRLAQAANSN